MGCEVTIVSGLPRSGTSMMMRMLEKGGVPILTDNIREADEDNLMGYYEYERVKQITEDATWLKDAEGRAVKLISALLKYLPPEYTYKVIFMQRDIHEVLASQRRMLERRGEPADEVPDETMKQLFETHLAQVDDLLRRQPNIEAIYVSYNETIKDPTTSAERVTRFLGKELDIKKMVDVVDPSLYRQRK